MQDHECRMPASCVEQFQDLAVAAAVAVESLAGHSKEGEERYKGLVRRFDDLSLSSDYRNNILIKRLDLHNGYIQKNLEWQNKMDGRFTVVMWLTGTLVTAMVGILAALIVSIIKGEL